MPSASLRDLAWSRNSAACHKVSLDQDNPKAPGHFDRKISLDPAAPSRHENGGRGDQWPTRPQNPTLIVAQPVSAPLTRAAIFLVVTINKGEDDVDAVRSFCADFAGLVRAVEFRDLEAGLSCVMGIGSDAWDRLFGDPRPAELHPFREFRAGSRQAIATPGDLLFHIRAKRMDLCFEIAAQIMAELGDAVTAVDEVHGFRYFDDRDLLGFVDGTENPRGQAVIDAALIGAEDAAFAGGSYVITQKYLHDLAGWNALPTETQERIIGRMKLSDIELDDLVKPTFAHNALTVDLRERARTCRSSATTCPSARSATANTAPISSAIAARRG